MRRAGLLLLGIFLFLPGVGLAYWPVWPTETGLITSGTATTGGSGTTLNAATGDDFTTLALAATGRHVILNVTDGSECAITAITDANTLVCSAGLTGGTNNTFADGDSYQVRHATDAITGPDWNRARALNATWQNVTVSSNAVTLDGDGKYLVTSCPTGLQTINGTVTGDVVILRIDGSGCTSLAITDNTGNIQLPGNSTFTLTSTEQALPLLHSGSVLSPLSLPQIFNAGSAGNPGIAPPGDPNTGIAWPAADTVSLCANGCDRALLTENGLQVLGAFNARMQANAFGTTSAFTAFIIGAVTGATADNGGLYAIGRRDKANEPFTALSGFDNGSARTVYVGGGGWGVPDATRILFYVAPSYSETNDTGVSVADMTTARVWFGKPVGVNYDVPPAQLAVAGAVAATPVVRVEGAASQSGDYFQVTTSGGAGGNVYRIESDGKLFSAPMATAPAACSIGHFYVDTSGAFCACTSTNTWTNTTGVGTCS